MRYCIIPARKGSKGIPNKNIKLLKGKPLIQHTIDAALNSKKFDDIITTSDGDEILDIAKSLNSNIRKRPAELASDSIHAIYAILDCIEYFKMKDDDLVCMLLATSPLRTCEDLIGAVESFNPSKYNSLISVYKSDKGATSYRYIEQNTLVPIIGKIEHFEIQRQEAKPVYEVNGSIYISTAGNLRVNKSFHKGITQPFIMTVEHSLDINNEWDWKLAEKLI